MSNVVASPAENSASRSPFPERRPLVLWTVGTLGFFAAVAQLALLRELIGAFEGNELGVGVALGCWLILTAIGTRLGSAVHGLKHPLRILASGVAGLTAWPIVAVLGLRGLRNVLLLPGSAVDPIAMLAGCTIVLAPFCLTSGALLTLAAHVLARDGDTAPVGRTYFADAMGSIGGAVVFTALASFGIDHVALLAVTGAATLATMAWIARQRHATALMAVCAIGSALLLGTTAFGDLDGRSTAWQFHGSVSWHESTPYGRLVAISDVGQWTLLENGMPIAFTANAADREEIVHYALAQRDATPEVLLIGGGAAGTAREALLHPSVQRVTCVELDPRAIAAARQLAPWDFSDPRIRFETDDARRYLRQTPDRFDAILVALPDPTTFQLNRFFTTEFFAEAKRRLQPGGVIAFALGRYENYASLELRRLLAAGRRTVASSFRHVAIVPGSRVYFIGSDQPLRRDIANALEAQHVSGVLVNRNYLEGMLTADRLADVDRAAAGDGPINTDFHPVLYLLRLRHWLSQFTIPVGGICLVIGVLFAAWAVRMRATSRMIFAGGFAASALEVSLLMAFQVSYGSLYRQIGVIVATFMVGLALGAEFMNRVRPTRPGRTLRGLGTTLALFALGFAFVLPKIGALDRLAGTTLAGQTVLVALTLALGAIVGAQFAVGAAGVSAISHRSASRLFSADLVGAATGSFLTSTFLLPWAGLTGACGFTAALNLAGVLLSWRSSRHS